MDAPIGYMASFRNYCAAHNDVVFEDFWSPDAPTEVHHFIGKDIVNFHALFWPAVLEGSGYRKPTRVHVHGFITVDGTKMSKSRGTFINSGTYLNHLNPEYLRYYFATKSNGTVDDIDITFEDFVQRVNSDLVGKIVNIASRCAGFINRLNDGELSQSIHDPRIVARVRRRGTRDRGVVRIGRLRQSRARNHRARRPGEPVHRAAGAVESRQRGRTRSRRPGGVHARHQSVQGADPVSRARAARDRATQRAVPEPRQSELGRSDALPGPPSHQRVRAAVDAHRNGSRREDDRRNPRNR